MAIRAALPVWRTTPNVVHQREGGIAPALLRIKAVGYDTNALPQKKFIFIYVYQI
jgi:hypothetical protein